MSKRIQVVGLGLAALDILVRAVDLPTWECGGRLQALGIDGGGPVATALVAAQQLGVQTGYIGTYGSDRMGRIKLETLTEYGIDTQYAIQREGVENHTVLVCVHGESGERIFSGVAGRRWSPLRVDELDRNYITSADILHLDGMQMEAALAAARWMQAAGKPVMLDGATTRGPIGQPMRDLIQHVDYLICGSGFVPALTGCSDLWEAGEAALELGPRVVVQTEGKDGSYTVSRDGRFHVPAFEVEVIDTTGTGDVFHGAYLVGLLKGWNLKQITLFSTAVAALKCARLGGRQGIPRYEQAIEFLCQRGIHIEEEG